MKNLTIKLMLFFLLMSGGTIDLSGQYRYTNQNNYYSGVDPTIVKRAEAAVLLLEGAGYTISNYDATYLAKGEEYVGTKTCYSGNEYIVMAFSGAGVRDLDLYVYDSVGNEISKSTGAADKGVSTLSYVQYRSATMYFKVKNYHSRSSTKSYPIIIVVAYKT